MTLVLFSGAGISAESGVPTFRGSDGLWEGEDLDVVCNYNTWKSNIPRVHAFYNRLRSGLEPIHPNAAHHKFVEWEQKYDAINLTQNVDCLFEKAGSKNIVHLHGNIREMKCEACGYIWDLGYGHFNPDTDRCRCGSLRGVKPNVVFFYENAPEYARLYKVFSKLKDTDTVVVMGTSSRVIDITGMLIDAPCRKIYSNVEKGNFVDRVYDHVIIAPATKAVQEIDDILSLSYRR